MRRVATALAVLSLAGVSAPAAEAHRTATADSTTAQRFLRSRCANFCWSFQMVLSGRATGLSEHGRRYDANLVKVNWIGWAHVCHPYVWIVHGNVWSHADRCYR